MTLFSVGPRWLPGLLPQHKGTNPWDPLPGNLCVSARGPLLRSTERHRIHPIKYISDKYAGKPFAPITIPEGASFADMVKLKGKKDIGDQINKAIIAPLANANNQLSQADFPDFNDPTKLGSGKEMVDRLTNLIGIFERRELDFSKNRAEGDDILGDAYEYLMRHFATESGKSKGQFYTPAEVSRIMARVIGIGQAKTSPATTAEIEEEHAGEEGAFAELEKVNKAEVTRLKEIGRDRRPGGPKSSSAEEQEEENVLEQCLQLGNEQTELKRAIKGAEAELDAAALARYSDLDQAAVKTLVVDDKWLATLDTAIHGEIDRIEQALTGRVKELAEMEGKVAEHLARMGFH